jgi:hypothetical protein
MSITAVLGSFLTEGVTMTEIGIDAWVELAKNEQLFVVGKDGVRHIPVKLDDYRWRLQPVRE